MIYKLEVQHLDWKGALEGIETNYVQTDAIERIEDRGNGKWYIYFHAHGILVHKDDPGVSELLEQFDTWAFPKPDTSEAKSDVPF